MSRNLHFGLAILILVLGSIVLTSYRTDAKEPMAEFGLPGQGEVSLKIEYATTTEARERGLSGRASIPEDYGMLFVFPKDGFHGFWMKDMLVPIDIFWLDDKGQVVYIAREVATSTYPNVLYPTVPARYVLETVAGLGAKHGIGVGTTLLLKNIPSVSE